METGDVVLEEERRKVTPEKKRKTMSAQELELERRRLTLESRLQTNELRSGIKYSGNIQGVRAILNSRRPS